MVGDVSNDATPGSLVKVLDKMHEPFGIGFWNPRAKIPLRVAAHGDREPSEEFFYDALKRAVSFRRDILQLDEITNAYRLVYGDADQLPGLVADKLDDVLSVEVSSLAVWQRLDQWLPILHEAAGTTRTQVLTNEDIARAESMPRVTHQLHERITRPIRIREHDLQFEINLADAHKTGFFCDQRENRLRFRSFTKNKSVLDLCSYTGGFSINAALGGAEEITAVDLDEKAIEQAKRNGNINQFQRIKFTHADAFTWARTMVENQRKWDVVMCDPPKFIYGKDEDNLGRNKYHDLNALAMKLVKPGGILVTCSCSGGLSAEEFEQTIISAAHRQQLRLQIFDRTGAGADHPTISNYPESRYLKVLWCRVF